MSQQLLTPYSSTPATEQFKKLQLAFKFQKEELPPALP